ncbi:M4 family metallopeptidase [Streptomyces sp. Q6]|uniref:M4 family metallopeptidase n=1 Tax=Streptomyces citrinus TaxID=3118173 RepID=A0ACD5AHF4_9ACTN
MDSALLAALIGTVGGGLATAGAAWLKGRTNARTAARLIYAELTRDSSAVAYFRQTGHWMAPNLSRAAWDNHGELIARRRSSESFETVHRGYEALELAPFLADDALSPAVRDQWLRGEVERLAAAIREIGALAQVSRPQVEQWTRRLEDAGRPDGGAPLIRTDTGMVPLTLLERIVDGSVPPLAYEGLGVVVSNGVVEVKAWAREEDLAEVVVFDAGGGKELDALPPVRWSGRPPTGDVAADEAYDGLTAAARFVREVLGRDTVVQKGGPLAAAVHYDKGFNNSFWNGSLIVFGDGDNKLFGRFTRCPELVGAEVWRSLPEMMTSFQFYGENGALSTSLCDVFGLLIKQFSLGQSVDEADWVLGAGLFAPGVRGVGLRSLKAPGTAYDDPTLGKDPQPAHMDDYVRTDRDNGGVHINGGIPGHAFYRLAAALGGNAWERAGLIWWVALISGEIGHRTRFADFARLTVAAARARYGDDSEELRAVRDSWDAVGIRP